jgi:hypothetical protein
MVIHAKMEENYINGLIRIFGRVPVGKNKSCSSLLEPGLSFVGRFEDGIPTGICWRGLIGGAWLYGKVDDFGEFTGDEIAYIYPDLKTSLLGKFINGTMVRNIAVLVKLNLWYYILILLIYFEIVLVFFTFNQI